jgi:hypothetical protein
MDTEKQRLDPQPISLQTTEPDKLENRIDNLLSKYLLVWIWSVLFGASSGLFYSFVGFGSSRPWGPLNLLLAILAAISLLSLVISNLALFRFLTLYLIPKFLVTSIKEDEDRVNHKSAILLRSAFAYMIFGAVARVLMTLAELIFSSLRGF